MSKEIEQFNKLDAKLDKAANDVIEFMETHDLDKETITRCGTHSMAVAARLTFENPRH